MNGIYLILLYMAKKINGERSLAGCYHILTGKKSAQAIQDARLYGFSSWYGLFPEWQRACFDREVSKLVEQGQLLPVNECYVPSKNGYNSLVASLQDYGFYKRAFLATTSSWAGREAMQFSKLFHLLSQVVSHYLWQQLRYQPIVQELEVQLAVKGVWQSIKDKESFVTRFSQEVEHFLEELNDDLLATIILERLSGYQVNGSTFQQIANRCGIPEALVRLYYYQVMGLLLQASSNHSSVLNALTKELSSSSSGLTGSAQRTYELLQQGFGVDRISSMRQLRRNTIEDHLIEIAIHSKHFDPSPFITSTQMEKIINISRQLNTKKLRLLKENLPTEISYFQIRLSLVLDKMNRERYATDEETRV